MKKMGANIVIVSIIVVVGLLSTSLNAVGQSRPEVLPQCKNEFDRNCLRRATFPELTPEAVAAIASALQDALAPSNIVSLGSLENRELLLKRHLERTKLIITDPHSYLGNLEPDFFNTPRGAALQDAMEAIADVATTQIQQFEVDGDAPALSNCTKAFITGATAITTGALFGDVGGAIAGFIGGVVGLALNC